MSVETQKPSHGEWLEWAQVVLDRLTTCVHVYSKPPYADVFIAEKERQGKNDIALSLLRRIHSLIDEGETPTASLADVAHHDERVIDGLAVLLRETLGLLPMLSADMQKLLKSEWYDKCNGRMASELFRGPMGDLPKGIGSGFPEQGRLPEVLATMLERERIGDSRQPRKELHRHADADTSSGGEPMPTRHTVDVKRRWADKNGQSLRSAGRIE
jgi:hypothetical protein